MFKMRDSVPSVSYSSVCNVFRQWSFSLIRTYRVGIWVHFKYNAYKDVIIDI